MTKSLVALIKKLDGNLEQLFIYGRNKYSKELASLLNIQAFVDDFTNEKLYEGKPVIKLTQLPQNAFVINCSYSMYPVSVWRRLNKLGFKHVSISQLICKGYISLQSNFFAAAKMDIKENHAAYTKIRKKFKNFDSLQVWDKLIAFRQSGDLAVMQDFVVDTDGQYFAEFVKLDAEVFVDLGAYDGETSEIFISKCPNYQAIHLFEPSSINMQLAKSRLQDNSNIYYHQLGVSDGPQQLSFNSSSGSASAVDSNGIETIQLDSLDNVIAEPISFLKIDIEGFERQAIIGATRHISQDHPLIAVAVYHYPNDLWQIPELVFSIRDDYQIELRHYTEGTDETIMYFLPIKDTFYEHG
tara:strand:- start:2196 stop:3260 length:1065 start_codon:yes stop_codon:yes gene_type:complete